MNIVDWNKINSKQKSELKHKVLILGPRNLSRKRIAEITHVDILFGLLKDNFIPGLKGDQFKSLQLDKLQKFTARKDLDVIMYFQKDTTYVVSELKPKKIKILNGSWSGPMHARKEFWTALDLNIPIEYLSSFSTKDKLNYIELSFEKDKVYTPEELMKIANKFSTNSFCWQVQVGAVISKDGRILSTGYNKILPKDNYCMENKCIREVMHLNPGQDTQICMANHAESEAIDYCARNGIKINGSTMYLSLSPCPVCAKLIARSGIKQIICEREYLQQNLGREILEKSNIDLKIIQH